MKKLLIFCVFLLIFTCFLPSVAYADVSDELAENVKNGVDSLDFSAFDDPEGIAEKILAVVNGEFTDSGDYLRSLLAVFSESLTNVLPTLALITAVCLIVSVVSGSSSGLISKSTDNVVVFVGISAVFMTSFTLVKSVYGEVTSVVEQTSKLVDASMPVLLTLVVANGGNATFSVCQPAVVLFGSGIVALVRNVIFPLSLYSIVLSSVSSLSDKVRVSKMSGFMIELSKWLLGATFMLFTAFLTVQGISSGAVDSISLKAAKFATKNYIPLLGGYLADGFDLIVAGTSLIKNAFGVVVLMMLLVYLVKPVITCVVVNLGLQLVAGLVEPVADKRFVKFLNGIGKALSFWAVVTLAVGVMFTMLVVVAMCSANVV